MKIKSLIFLALFSAAGAIACDGKPSNPNATTAKASPRTATPTAVPTTSTPKNGDYPGKGEVTKINLEGNGSVEMRHDEIEGVMPAMQMEFHVSDKKMLEGLKVGDKVDFTLRYKDHTEILVEIKKAK